MDAMERLMEGRTTIMIAHRHSTLEGCSVRLQIENGRAQVSHTREMIAARSRETAHEDASAR
jgi:ABC-type multidrug transport system fused ATPase/permease subunit